MLAEQRAKLGGQIETLLSERRQMAHGAVSVDRLIEAQRYEMVLRADIASLREREEKVIAEVARRRQALLEADREVRTLVRLRETQQERYTEREAQLEQKQIDEVANRMRREEAEA